jgi:cytochrome c oxidase subunit 2
MTPDFSLFPEQASTFAGSVDGLYFFIIGVCFFFSVVTAVLLIVFALKYRRRAGNELPPQHVDSIKMEIGWSSALLVLFVGIFCWSARLFFVMAQPPADALEIYVVGKQWMWKVQHEEGQREINELHVPVGRPILLIMTSEDVIHSFSVPAFRIKQDVLPGRFTTLWFEATRSGRYHLFCAQYCGTQHSRMGGWVTVMEPADYEAWLTGAMPPASRPAGTMDQAPAEEWLTGSQADLSMATRGRQLFLKLQCIACHSGDSRARAPLLEELYGKTVTLADGSTVVADDNYIRESIRQPGAKIVAGYQPIMPVFGPEQVDETELQQLVVFIKSLGRGQTPMRNERTPPPLTAPPRP